MVRSLPSANEAVQTTARDKKAANDRQARIAEVKDFADLREKLPEADGRRRLGFRG